MRLCNLSNYALRSLLMTFNHTNRKNIYIANVDGLSKVQLIWCIETMPKLFPSPMSSVPPCPPHLQGSGSQ